MVEPNLILSNNEWFSLETEVRLSAFDENVVPGAFLRTMGTASKCYLLLGQAAWMRNEDPLAAKEWFTRIERGLERFDEFGAMSRTLLLQDKDSAVAFRWDDLCDPLICMLLVDSPSCRDRLKAWFSGGLFSDYYDNNGGFARDLINVILNKKLSEPDCKRSLRKSYLEGYWEALVAVSQSDTSTLSAYVSKWPEIFEAKKRAKSDVHLVFGYGKVARELTFDIVGAVILRCAWQKGVDLGIDTKTLPRWAYARAIA
jgi:hypothetical protein